MERGLSESLAVITVSITGIANAAGRLGMATASDKIGRTGTIIFLAALTAACATALIWARGALFVVVIALTAFAYGGPSATFPAMTTDIGGARYSGTNYGIAMLGLGFSSVVFNWLSGLLTESTGSFSASLVMAALTCLVPIILMIVYKNTAKKIA